MDSVPWTMRRPLALSRWMGWIWGSVLAGMLLFALSVRAAEPPLPLDTYWELLEATHARLTDLSGVAPETARPALDELAAQWDPVTAVVLPDGTLLPIDTRYLTSLLHAQTPDLPYLIEIIETSLAARTTWPQEAFGEADLTRLKALLLRPEFQWQTAPENPIQQFIQEVLRRINHALVNFVDWLFPDRNGGITIPLNLIFTLISAGLLMVIFFYILRGTWGNLIAEAESAAHGHEETLPLTAEAARQRARQLAQAGDRRTAIRYLYLASLLLLEERGILRYDRTLTNRETLRSVANRPDLVAPLQEVVETFDRVWYGYQEVDQPTFEHFAESVEDLREKK